MNREPETAQQTDARFRTMADNAPVMIWVAGLDMARGFFSEGWLRFRGRTLQEEQAAGWLEGVHPDDTAECWETYSSAFAARQPFRMEYRLRRHDGSYRWVLDTGAPSTGSDGEFEGYIGSGIDVTELRESRERLLGLVREKEMLLKELHHRVKNNLQMIIGYVTLRLSTAKSPEAVAVLKQVVQRITSLALIHQQAVSDRDGSDIDFSVFLRGLMDSMQSVESRPEVEVSLKADPVHLALERAIPLGLLCNELLSNCYRHAFPGHREGEIAVELKRTGDDLRLIVTDNGPGFDMESRRRTGFGLTLIDLLADQAGGSIDFDQKKGVTATITVQKASEALN